MDTLKDTPGFIVRLGDLPRVTGFPFQVRTIGYLKDNWHNDERRNKDAVIFGLTLSARDGMIHRLINGREIRERCPSVGFMRPGDYLQNLSPSPWDEFYFSYQPSALDALEALGLKLPNPSSWGAAFTPTLVNALRILFQLMKNHHGTGNIDRIDSVCFHIMIECLVAALAPADDDPVDAIVKEALSLMRLNYCEPFDIKVFLRKRGIGYRTFLRRWNAAMSKPPTQYALDLRMEEARRLLSETSLSVKEIAAELHFADQLYFSRLFHRHESVSPRQYRSATVSDLN